MRYDLLGKLKDGKWHYLGEPYRRVFCEYEKEGLTEHEIVREFMYHRITRKGMDKLWALGLWQ